RDLQRLRRHIRKVAAEPLRAVLAHRPQRVYGSSGSIHAMAHVTHWEEHGEPIEHLNGHVMPLDALSLMVRRMQRMSTSERERLPGIDAMRAEIIVPGAMVLAHVLEESGGDEITMSDYGVREGLVTDYLIFHARELSSIASIEDLRLRSVLQCLAKFQ